MQYDRCAPVPLYRFDSLSGLHGVLQAVTTRRGGASLPPFRSLNLSFAVGDDPCVVRANRRTLAEALGVGPDDFVAARQPHGNAVAVVGAGDRGRGALDEETAFADADALVTKDRGLVLLCFSADCPPVVLVDPTQGALGVAHSGWRGTVAGVAVEAARTMSHRFGCRPADLIVCIGPGIGGCCFDAGPEVLRAIDERAPALNRFIHRRDGQAYFDIPAAIRWQLINVGVKEHSIEMSGLCTACRVDEFFSYRVEGGLTGRFAAVAGLR